MRDNRNPQNRSDDRHQDTQPIPFDHRIITQGGEILVETADKLGQQLVRDELTKSQIRNIYGAVKKMQMRGFNEHQFLMLKPKLAYAAGRHKTVKRLKDVLTQAIDEVKGNPENFNRFVDFFEAILAYHKSYGGKD